MKYLRLNPQSHEIILGADDAADGLSTVSFTFGEHRGDITLNADEAKKIGTWFTKLSAEMDKT